MTTIHSVDDRSNLPCHNVSRFPFGPLRLGNITISYNNFITNVTFEDRTIISKRGNWMHDCNETYLWIVCCNEINRVHCITGEVRRAQCQPGTKCVRDGNVLYYQEDSGVGITVYALDDAMRITKVCDRDYYVQLDLLGTRLVTNSILMGIVDMDGHTLIEGDNMTPFVIFANRYIIMGDRLLNERLELISWPFIEHVINFHIPSIYPWERPRILIKTHKGCYIIDEHLHITAFFPGAKTLYISYANVSS